MSAKSSLRALALASAVAVPSMASFASAATPAPFSLADESRLAAAPAQSAEPQQAPAMSLADGPRAAYPQYLADAAPAAEQPNIHGFAEVPFKTAYVTPRGLVVENAGLVIQPVAGLVFPIGDFGAVKGVTVVTGVWNSL